MIGKLVVLGTALFYGVKYREEVTERYALAKPIARQYHLRAKEMVVEFITNVVDLSVRMKWAYKHPEILGYAGSGLSGTSWLDPFYGNHEGDYRTKDDHAWTWKDAPNVKITPLDDSPVVEVKPMGKILLGG